MIHKEGRPYILSFLLASGIAYFLGRTKWCLGLLGLSLASAYFFRNPKREPLYNPEYVISPADGKIVLCQVENRPGWYEGPLYRVGIFMRLWDVHLNRAPVTGKVLKIVHLKGNKNPVFKENAFEKNEKIIYLIEREDGVPFWVVQIAGTVARRIKNFVFPGDNVVAGDLIGIIKFSSRVELLFPYENSEIFVKQGQKVFAGETILAKLPLKK
ncbi:MAG: phosphatidylserine decarboxylase [Caldimicrobium sp.]